MLRLPSRAHCAANEIDRPLRRAGRGRPLDAAPLERLDVDGLGALVAGLGVVRHLRALGDGAVAVGDDRLVVDEEVLARLIGSDEAEALLVAEPLDGSCCHVLILLVRTTRTLHMRQRRERWHCCGSDTVSESGTRVRLALARVPWASGCRKRC